MDWRVRAVRHGAQFELACREIKDQIALADMERLLRAVNWIIARDAESFPVDANGLRVYRYRKTKVYPTLVFYFTIDPDDDCESPSNASGRPVVRVPAA